MKQLTMTPALAAMIQEALGDDVDPSQFAVFESIALNMRPLPYKRGSLFEGAVVGADTLKLMVDHINGGNHLPLVFDHELTGAPKGRVFHAGLDVSDVLELRVLFYVDPTETELIAKLNAGTLDEVSVSFLAQSCLCSECGWDYFAPGNMSYVWDRTCANGHKLGEDGVHANLHGLRQFIEVSLVARGAADNPKIIGKSKAKLAPETAQRLAASGFEPDELVVEASMQKDEDQMSNDAALSQIATLSSRNGELTANLTAMTTRATAAEEQVATLTADLAARDATIADLNSKLAANTDAAELSSAVGVLQSQLNALRVASGKTELTADELPKEVSVLKSQIDELTTGLTAILPVGGRANGAGGENHEGLGGASAAVNVAAFKLRA